MAYLPPHKRHPSTTASTSTPAPNPPPLSLSSSLRSLSLSSPRGRGRGAGGRHPRASTKIIHAAGCISRWSPLPPFSPGGDGEEHTLRLEPFPCAPIEHRTGAKPLALVVASTPGQGSSGSTAAAVTAIAERFLPDLLVAAERTKAEGAPKDELVKLSLVARLGKVLFQCQPGGSPVSLDTLRQAAKAGEDGSKSQLRKSFYTNVPSECLDDMERSMVKRMGLDFDSSKEHYHVKVFDKNQSDSTISCKCTVEEDGSLAIHKVRHLVEDISCLFKGLDLRLMLCKKRILKNLDSEVENAVKSLVSAAVIDPNVKGGIRWPLGKQSIGERFSIVGVWHTNYKTFRNETMRLKLRHADRFDHRSSTGEVSDEVTFKLTAISRKLEVELNQVRYLVEDISCLFKGLDLRLMFCKKRILKNLDSEVENAVKSLVSAAIIDPNVKGGIRWPLGKESIGERFSIVGAWHTNYKAFKNETMRLKLRHADRFDHRSSTGEVSDEVTFKLTAISRKLEEEGDPVENSVKEMLESAVQMVWDNALNCQIVP